VERVVTAFDSVWLQDRPCSNRLLDTLDSSQAQVGELIEIAKQAPRGVGDDDGIGLGECENARGEVWCLAENVALLRVARPDQIADHDKARRNTNSDLQSGRAWKRAHGLDQFETGANGALGVVLVSIRISEIDEDAVTAEACDKAVEPPDRLGDRILIGADERAQIFGID